MRTESSYAATFDERGHAYHQAMLSWPEVRAAEFLELVARADLAPNHVVLDLPSGGGYLARYLPQGQRCLHLETSRAFFAAGRDAGREVVLARSLSSLPLESASVDRALSLAGLHHEPERLPLYREVARVLAADGRFVIADVLEGSRVARFLDEFVDAHGDGHRGHYLAERDEELLRDAGLRCDSFAAAPVRWRARSGQELARFCRALFSIERASEALVLEGLREYVGLHEVEGGVELAWELGFACCSHSPC